jgi:hypothetical protein
MPNLKLMITKFVKTIIYNEIVKIFDKNYDYDMISFIKIKQNLSQF